MYRGALHCGTLPKPASLQGFFYNRYAAPREREGELGTETDANFNQWLYYHRMGTTQSADSFLLAEPDHPDWMFTASVTDDGRSARQASLLRLVLLPLAVWA